MRSIPYGAPPRFLAGSIAAFGAVILPVLLLMPGVHVAGDTELPSLARLVAQWLAALVAGHGAALLALHRRLDGRDGVGGYRPALAGTCAAACFMGATMLASAALSPLGRLATAAGMGAALTLVFVLPVTVAGGRTGTRCAAPSGEACAPSSR